jgi:hypothetical protein
MIYLTGRRLRVGCREVVHKQVRMVRNWVRSCQPSVDCIDEFGAASQPSGSKLPRHKGKEGDESLVLNFHQRRVAVSVCDTSCLCAKITFTEFEISSSK